MSLDLTIKYKTKQDIPIFDSLTHPTINGGWMAKTNSEDNSFSALLESMRVSNIRWAFAVGMSNVGEYDVLLYAKLCRRQALDILLPIAFFDVNLYKHEEDVLTFLKTLVALGYYGIKLHPRIGNFNLDASTLPFIIRKANELGLIVLLCTYFYGTNEICCSDDIGDLAQLLPKIKNEKVVLLHGGTLRLLEMMEIVRNYPNMLLDLSFTLCRYEKSSIDLDIQYLFENFDRKLCLGSDSPQFSPNKLRARFNYFSQKIDFSKAVNIAHGNLCKLLGISL